MPAARLRRPEDDTDLLRLLEDAVGASPGARGNELRGENTRQASPADRLRCAVNGSADTAVFAGTYENIVVGVALLAVRNSPSGRLGVIEELFVESQAREVGVGEALMAGALDWFRSHEAVAVDMEALPGDRATKNLCERSGLSARLIVMHRRL